MRCQGRRRRLVGGGSSAAAARRAGVSSIGFVYSCILYRSGLPGYGTVPQYGCVRVFGALLTNLLWSRQKQKKLPTTGTNGKCQISTWVLPLSNFITERALVHVHYMHCARQPATPSVQAENMVRIVDFRCTVIGGYPVLRIVTDTGIDGFAQVRTKHDPPPRAPSPPHPRLHGPPFHTHTLPDVGAHVVPLLRADDGGPAVHCTAGREVEGALPGALHNVLPRHGARCRPDRRRARDEADPQPRRL